jgi:hypothetical protein
MVVANNEIDGDKKYTSNAGNFDGHADTAVQCGAICLMERIRGFMQSHICHHWASAHAVLPRRPPWSMILNETKKHKQNTTFT